MKKLFHFNSKKQDSFLWERNSLDAIQSSTSDLKNLENTLNKESYFSISKRKNLPTKGVKAMQRLLKPLFNKAETDLKNKNSAFYKLVEEKFPNSLQNFKNRTETLYKKDDGDYGHSTLLAVAYLQFLEGGSVDGAFGGKSLKLLEKQKGISETKNKLKDVEKEVADIPDPRKAFEVDNGLNRILGKDCYFIEEELIFILSVQNDGVHVIYEGISGGKHVPAEKRKTIARIPLQKLYLVIKNKELGKSEKKDSIKRIIDEVTTNFDPDSIPISTRKNDVPPKKINNTQELLDRINAPAVSKADIIKAIGAEYNYLKPGYTDVFSAKINKNDEIVITHKETAFSEEKEIKRVPFSFIIKNSKNPKNYIKNYISEWIESDPTKATTLEESKSPTKIVETEQKLKKQLEEINTATISDADIINTLKKPCFYAPSGRRDTFVSKVDKDNKIVIVTHHKGTVHSKGTQVLEIPFSELMKESRNTKKAIQNKINEWVWSHEEQTTTKKAHLKKLRNPQYEGEIRVPKQKRSKKITEILESKKSDKEKAKLLLDAVLERNYIYLKDKKMFKLETKDDGVHIIHQGSNPFKKKQEDTKKMLSLNSIIENPENIESIMKGLIHEWIEKNKN